MGREERGFMNNDIIICRLSIPIFGAIVSWGNLELGPSNGIMAA